MPDAEFELTSSSLKNEHASIYATVETHNAAVAEKKTVCTDARLSLCYVEIMFSVLRTRYVDISTP